MLITSPTFLLWAAALVLLSLPSYLLCTALYNIFLHPYAKYPGPFWAKVTPLYSLWHAYVGDLHVDVLRCHNKYGMRASSTLQNRKCLR